MLIIENIVTGIHASMSNMKLLKDREKKTIILGIRRIRHYCPQIRIQVAAETTAIYLRTSYGVPTQFDT